MRFTVKRVLLAGALVGVGWAAGRAQTAAPAFELLLEAPAGQVTVQCVRGCELAWVERGVNPDDTPKRTFTFGCKGPGVERCRSGRIGGWTTP
jgi:hypothetical protein